MSRGRSVPLFDPGAEPATWNERMVPGELAVHQSSSGNASPTCMVFPGFSQAEAYAEQQIQDHPTLRCRIYDHQGFIGAPLKELRGADFKGESEITPGIRRWGGSAFLLAGIILVLIDWHSDFKLTWPAVVGSRLLIPGLVLLATEGLILLQAKHSVRRRAGV